MSNPKVSKGGFKSDIKQLFLLIWKNYSLQKRSIISTAFEILIPALFAIILLPIRTIVKSQQFVNDTVYEPFSFNALPGNLTPKNQIETDLKPGFFPDSCLPYIKPFPYTDLAPPVWEYAYSPNNNSFVTKIMTEVATNLKLNLKGTNCLWYSKFPKRKLIYFCL
jgi:hypothetical protein